jgi:DNA repair protein RadC
MHHIPPADRPRERLRSLGGAALSTRELLAILVGSGGRSGSALDVADRLLVWGSGSLRRLDTLAWGDQEVPGVGGATASRLAAALELGRRAAREPLPERARIRGPADVHALVGPRLRDLPQEEFHVLLLNTQHRVLRTVLVTRGVLDASLIHPREVFRPAIREAAAAVVLVHNHPSGDPAPSAEDRAVTRSLARAGQTLGIRVLDHVIVGDDQWVSMADAGELDP